MTASKKTIKHVLEILHKHLTNDQIREVVRELRNVEGNKSFMQTIRALWYEVKGGR